jgi:hypothetical protein
MCCPRRSSPGRSSSDTGFGRDYGTNPYTAYDTDPDSQPFLLRGEPDRSLPPKERVAAVKTGDQSAVVYPFSRLAREAPINDSVAGEPLVVLFDPEVASALDAAQVSGGRSVGAAAVFSRAVDTRELSFIAGAEPGTYRDRETGSGWDLRGRATSGPLAGTQLEQIPHDDQFWFALAAFYPEAEIRR